MATLSFILVVIAMLMTLGVLFAGLIVMAIGGDKAPQRGNTLMQWRVICQAVAILLFGLAMLIKR
ncbi:MAG: hypothetical protein OHK0024_33280 [Thalassobaculales bacterium]